MATLQHVQTYSFVPSSGGTVSAKATLTLTYSMRMLDQNYTVLASSLSVSTITYSSNISSYSLAIKNTVTTGLKNSLKKTWNFTVGGTTVASKANPEVGKTYTLSGSKTMNRTHASQTVKLVFGNASYNVTIPAKQSFVVSFNANGGSSVSNLTKWWGENLAINVTSSKAGYIFRGWATTLARANEKNDNQTPKYIDYSSSKPYTTDAATTLYAVWEKSYIKPIVSNVTAERCNNNGDLDDEGKFAKVKFNWAIDVTKYSGNTVDSISVTVGEVTRTLTATGSSGSFDDTNAVIVGEGDGSFNTDNTYPITITITDTCREATPSTSTGKLGLAYFPLDISRNGDSIAWAMPAPDDTHGIYIGDVVNVYNDFVNMLNAEINKDTFFRATRTDEGTSVGFGVGAGGINHGVWSYVLDKWMVYADTTSVYINGVKFESHATGHCTKYGSVWTSGDITLVKRGNVVQCVGNPTITAVSSRTQVATIPEGFRPVGVAYAQLNGGTDYWIFNPNGIVQTGASEAAGTKYFSLVWVLQ